MRKVMLNHVLHVLCPRAPCAQLLRPLSANSDFSLSWGLLYGNRQMHIKGCYAALVAPNMTR